MTADTGVKARPEKGPDDAERQAEREQARQELAAALRGDSQDGRTDARRLQSGLVAALEFGPDIKWLVDQLAALTERVDQLEAASTTTRKAATR